MSDRSNLLVVDGISAIYNHAISALHGVSLAVKQGEIRAILGANGAGKTTTLKAISNILSAERGQITAGRITFDGLDVTKTKPSDLVRAGLVPVLEGRHVFKSLTVEENLTTGGLGRGSTRSEIKSDLERVYALFPSLTRKRTISAGLTSGGEQQMVAVGRALMARPRLLILDEPSMGLAPIVVQSIFDTLRNLNRKDGVTILLAEQNAAVALRYAQTATVLENGESVLHGTADDLRNRSDVREFYLGSSAARASINDARTNDIVHEVIAAE
jgi:branched-chain amino acid transport system ATP-binding protein